MPNSHKRNLGELIAKYKLHPNLRDLYVEGPRDQYFFSNYAGASGLNRVAVYPIGEFDIDPVPVAEGGGGHSGRLLTLAFGLDAALGNNSYGARCLIDRDFFGLLFPAPPSTHLFMTDYGCLESYALTIQSMNDLWSMYFLKNTSEEEIDSVITVANSVFLLRATKFMLDHSTPWLKNYSGELGFENQVVTFDEGQFIQKLIARSAGSLSIESFNAMKAQLTPQLQGDRRLFVHGHDLIKILAWLGREKNASHHLCNEEPLKGALLVSIDRGAIQGEPLFTALELWAT